MISCISTQAIIVGLIDTIDPTTCDELVLHAVSEVVATSWDADAHLRVLLLIVLEFLGE